MQSEIEALYHNKPESYTDDHFQLFAEFKIGLNRGQIRAAQPDAGSPTGWRVNTWVKQGILLGFRMGGIVDTSVDGAYVGEGNMVDSHALEGSCAQIGRNCHISAAGQIGGVLEQIGPLPVIDVLIGGNCGVKAAS